MHNIIVGPLNRNGFQPIIATVDLARRVPSIIALKISHCMRSENESTEPALLFLQPLAFNSKRPENPVPVIPRPVLPEREHFVQELEILLGFGV